MLKNKITILQPHIPHYRTEFFSILKKQFSILDLYVYDSVLKTRKLGFQLDYTNFYYIKNVNYKGILLYNPFTLINKKYDTLVLMWHFAHITTWLLLLTKFFHRKKIILWGQGISVKRYMKEENEPSILMQLMLTLADGAWVYMQKEAKVWQKIFPQKKIVALNNTLSGTEEMLKYRSMYNKDDLKRKYNIKEDKILIFCARFTNPYRRVDLLVEVIERLSKDKFGYIIIGDGEHKPDFSLYDNVYDFGALYDNEIKKELFFIADLYFQPGWVGLSIVEAMAYGKPVCTFRRSKETLQCVEYSYIANGVNGLIFKDIDDCINTINSLSNVDIIRMGNKAKQLVKEKLSICNMAASAISIL